MLAGHFVGVTRRRAAWGRDVARREGQLDATARSLLVLTTTSLFVLELLHDPRLQAHTSLVLGRMPTREHPRNFTHPSSDQPLP
jgi:hypothetical protein